MRSTSELTPYNEIRSELDTFDLVLWSSGDKLAKLIQVGTASPWTHVGLIVRFPGDLLMLWESTFDEKFSGVRLIPLSKALCDDISIRKATLNRTTELFSKLMEVRKDLDGRPFENNILEFICAAYDGPFGGNKRNISSLFCSELIAETLQRTGLLDSSKPSNEYTPKDFSSSNVGLELIGISYGPEIPISYATNSYSAKAFNTATISHLYNRKPTCES